MVTLLRRVVAADEAHETRVFLFMAAFGLVVAAIYWLVSYEPAGTAMLGGFGLATGVIGLRLAVAPVSRQLRRHGRAGAPAPAVARVPDVPDVPDVPEKDAPGGGAGGVDRPFLDESGRLPDETIAPFAVGIGLAVAFTGVIFGPAPVVVGALPLAWGAWAWLTAARDELAATDRGELVATDRDDRPV